MSLRYLATYRRLTPAALILFCCLALPAQTLEYATFFGGEFAEPIDQPHQQLVHYHMLGP